jgi:orotate phosphoribosyltransferase
MLTANQTVEDILKESEAWLTGHFLLTGGKHSDQYLQCQKVLRYPRKGAILANMLADQLMEQSIIPEVVAGPAMGAIHWELLVAQAFDNRSNEPVIGVFAERPAGSDEFEIRRGIELKPNQKVLVVEDVTTTGGSARKVCELVRKLGANPIAVAAIVDRSGSAVQFDVPFYSLLKLNLSVYEPDQCPMCKEGKPVVKPGSSKKN